jgi:hypothetical protein
MIFLWVLTRVDLPNVSEQHTVSIFIREDGDGIFLRNVGFYR